MNATVLPFPCGLPLTIDDRGVLEVRVVVEGKINGIFEGEGFLELGSDGALLVLEGDNDCERSEVIG